MFVAVTFFSSCGQSSLSCCCARSLVHSHIDPFGHQLHREESRCFSDPADHPKNKCFLLSLPVRHFGMACSFSCACSCDGRAATSRQADLGDPVLMRVNCVNVCVTIINPHKQTRYTACLLVLKYLADKFVILIVGQLFNAENLYYWSIHSVLPLSVEWLYPFEM